MLYTARGTYVHKSSVIAIVADVRNYTISAPDYDSERSTDDSIWYDQLPFRLRECTIDGFKTINAYQKFIEFKDAQLNHFIA